MDVLGPTLPAPSAPYLLPSEEREREWQERIGPRKRDCASRWSGQAIRSREDDVLRSDSAVPRWRPSPDVRDVEYVSLQKEAQPKYFRDVPIPLLDFTKDIRDFADSAAILRQCDLLISIDTAAAHLAARAACRAGCCLPQAQGLALGNGRRRRSLGTRTHRSFRVDRNRNWIPLLESVAVELAGDIRLTDPDGKENGPDSPARSCF